ncbi:alpha/beta hydrolase [Micromonospora sp. WMMD964]|uniref:alpha/beta hydrolase n=1 Tax=Micromonospora sp. WMMD964 TaxID=3016091 RepID=UPI00249B4574|nr:alpha/beta hydrolase [Micromonospora sp. WMMD964]WFE98672.1 alpha/beta hydrolase [Micromonospora sp. WMMD964]
MPTKMPRILAAGLGVSAVALVAGATYQAAATRRDRRLIPGPGGDVDIGGRTLRVHTTGLGEQPGPTVVFESGMATPLELWAWIQEGVAGFAPTVAYDRAGIGRSAPGELPRTAERTTDDLEALLDAVGARPPYVLVAHSYGGLLVRHFAERHPEQVAGLVLADVAHPEELVRSQRQRVGLPFVEQYLRDSMWQSTIGMIRLNPNSDRRFRIDGLPEEARLSAKAAFCTRQMWHGSYAEFEAWQSDVNAEVRDAKLPPQCRLYVLTAGATVTGDPVHLQLQEELARLSDDAVHEIVDDVEHIELITHEEPAARVVAAVQSVVRAVREQRTLHPADHKSGRER